MIQILGVEGEKRWKDRKQAEVRQDGSCCLWGRGKAAWELSGLGERARRRRGLRVPKGLLSPPN